MSSDGAVLIRKRPLDGYIVAQYINMSEPWPSLETTRGLTGYQTIDACQAMWRGMASETEGGFILDNDSFNEVTPETDEWIIDTTQYNKGTLEKVWDLLDNTFGVSLSTQQKQNIFDKFQNEGILFRENLTAVPMRGDEKPDPKIVHEEYAHGELFGGLIEDKDKKWLIFLDRTQTPTLYYKERTKTGAVIGKPIVL